MGSDHHGHEAETHHAKGEESAEHADEPEEHAKEEKGEHKEDHHEEGAEHDDAGHLLGAGIGVLAGLLLFLGHLLNIRALRKCEEPCCD